MKSMLRIHALKAQLEESRLHCESLAADLKAATIAKDKSKITREWERTMQERHTLQFALALLERRKREEATHS
jgi:hypothetical protein